MAANLPESAELFTEAVNSFRDTLTDKQRNGFKQFPDPESMLKDISSTYRRHKDASKIYSCCTKVAKFSDVFKPYFEVIGIFVQVKPEYMGIIWGSIRLIFQLGENHIVFLEKISDLFSSLALVIPQYQAHYETCRQKVFSHTDQSRLMKIMGFVYEDIIRFCQEIYLIFGLRGNEHGVKRNLRLFRDSVWKPFDIRFNQLQERMRRHQILFDQEMRLHDHEILSRHLGEFQDFMQKNEKLSNREREKEAANQKALAVAKLVRIQQWIWNSEHKTVYEKARQGRYPGSCDWIFAKPQYLEWRSQEFGTSEAGIPSTWTQRLLSIQAKPGFGKTTISTAIIEDLTDTATSSLQSEEGPPKVVFFHFDGTERSGCKTSKEAFRSITAQLVHARRNDKRLMDALAVLFEASADSQREASANDIDALLRFLLEQSLTFVVVDGVDECSDSRYFLSKLQELMTRFPCRILLLSRPELKFPYGFSRGGNISWEMLLNASDNAKSIGAFLWMRLDDLVNEDLFGDYLIEEDVVNDLTGRANGMFLWATLLINYLDCPALSPYERIAVLQEGSLLEGLGAIYNRILQVIGRAYREQQDLASEILKWISTSVYPLELEELRFALAIRPGIATSKNQLLPDYPKCISRITCSLVDINDRTASFIHLSLKQFLENDPDCHPFFSLKNKEMIHARMATVCISYLTHDIPRGPLRPLEVDHSLETGGITCGLMTRQEEPLPRGEKMARLAKNYALLKYASLCWDTHLLRSLSTQNPSRRKGDNETLPSNRGAFISGTIYNHIWIDGAVPRLENDEQYPFFSGPMVFPGVVSEVQRTNTLNPAYQANDPPATGESIIKAPWVPLLSEFILIRHTVTAWVEACWTFNLRPDLSCLRLNLHNICSKYSTHSANARELHWVKAGLTQLAAALNDLQEKHEHALSDNPTLIWQPHIKAATDPKFWPDWTEGSPDNVVEDKRTIVVGSGSKPQYQLRQERPTNATIAMASGSSLPVFS